MKTVKYKNGEPIKVVGNFQSFTGILENISYTLPYTKKQIINVWNKF